MDCRIVYTTSGATAWPSVTGTNNNTVAPTVTCTDSRAGDNTTQGIVPDTTSQANLIVSNVAKVQYATNATFSFTVLRNYTSTQNDTSDYAVTDGEKLNLFVGYGTITTSSRAPVTGRYNTTIVAAQLPRFAESGALFNFAVSMFAVVGAVFVAAF